MDLTPTNIELDEGLVISDITSSASLIEMKVRWRKLQREEHHVGVIVTAD
jgi:hypothetical protein